MERLDDARLVAMARENNREAFTQLIQRYQNQVYSLAYRLCNNPDDAKDLAQEAFIKLYQVLDKYDSQRPFAPWLYRVVTNVCYSQLRRRPRETVPLEGVIELTPLLPSQASNQPEERYEQEETQRLVRQAIAELPENYRLPIVLRYLEDFSYRQIAEIMEVPVSTVETRLYRGRALLQKRLAQWLERREASELPGS